MATAEICNSARVRGGGRLMEESTGCENGAVSLRRRRMEIRRFKMVTNANVFVEQPVSKRLRPVSGISNNVPPRHRGEGGRDDDDDEEVVMEEVVEKGGSGESSGGGVDDALCFTNRDNTLCGSSCSVEWGQENSALRLSVCDVIPDLEHAASSLSTSWERPSGGVLDVYGENECVNGSSKIVGNHSIDRMSSGGSSSSGQHMEESDVSSTLTSVGGFQSTLGKDTFTAQEFSQALAAGSQNSGAQHSSQALALGPQSSGAQQFPQALAAGPQSSGAEQAFQALAAGPHSSGAQQSSQALAGGPQNSGTEDMAASTATEILTTGRVGNQNLDMSGVYPQHTSPWQVSGNESMIDSNVVVAGDIGGSSVNSNCFASNACPQHGMVSLCGRRREMEDAVVSKDSFMKLPCNKVGGCDASGLEAAPLHYFGVYDGHGGSQAANFCAERLHQALAEEIESCFVQGQNVDPNSGDWEAKWETAMTQCFKRMDAEVGGFCLEEGECQASDNHRCCPDPIAPETVGTTAIVAVVGACQIIVGNCGDSRAVLSRGGVAIPLSVDHKPEREDEMARVEAAGGRVIYWNGYRVLGVLAMSRAIGDRYLRPYVIAEPEVKCVKRAEDDECLILASDGLWDVMSNEAVCDIARRALNCKRNGQPPDASSSSSSDEETPAAQAAALLVKLALAKGSSDNISVVVVDLKANR